MKPTPSDSLPIALAHHQAGRLDDARTLYESILTRQPDHAHALHYLGLIAHQRGDQSTALDLMRRSIAADATIPDFFCNLGAVLKDMAQWDQAIAAWRRAILLRPNFPQALSNLGDALRVQKQFPEAIELITRSLQLRRSPDTLQNLGLALLDAGEPAKAVAAFKEALSFRPDDPTTIKSLGTAFEKAGEPLKGVEILRLMLRLNAHDADAHFRLGNALRAAGQLSDAADSFRTALALDATNPDLHTNLGATLTDIAQPAQAIPHFQAALKLNPSLPEAHYNLALAQLMTGDFANGWREYEWRWQCPNFLNMLPPVDRPQWDGSDLAGKKILLRSEQGCGDAIQFIRYAPLLAARGATVSVECQHELLRLFSHADGITRAIPRGGDLGDYDVQLPMLSLPLRLGTTLKTIPSSTAYLRPDPDCQANWQPRIRIAPFRCGLVWAGNPAHRNDRNRSIPPTTLSPLANLPKVTFFSLQKDARREDLPLIDLVPQLSDFAETAAALSHLNLLITADTSVAHLAGAIGLETWLMIPFAPDWRWMLASSTTPWYESIRLFRQQAPGDWDGVIRRIIGALYFKLARLAA